MAKRLVFALVLVFTGVAASGCATGNGYLGVNPYPGPLGQVVAGNLALTCPGDYFIGSPINRCLRNVGGDFGRYSGYSMYRGGMGGQQLSQADKVSILCGLGGSGAAMLLNASLNKVVGSGLLSAASCGVAGAVLNRGGLNRGGKGSKKQSRQGIGQSVRYAPDGTPIAVGTRPADGQISDPPSSGKGEEWRITNRTSKIAELWDGDKFVSRIRAGQSMMAKAPKEGYKAILIIPNSSGGFDQEPAQIRSNDNFNGWDIIAPAVQ